MTTKPEAQDDVQAKLDKLLGAMSNLGQGVADLNRRLGDVETKVRQSDMRTAKFQPMQQPQGMVKPKPNLQQLQSNGQYASDGQSLTVSATGLLAPYTRILYPNGTIVRFNPESDVYQRMKAAYERDPKRAKFDPDQGEGVVITTHFVNADWEVKYRVRFDGLTPPRGDGFYESELIPA